MKNHPNDKDEGKFLTYLGNSIGICAATRLLLHCSHEIIDLLVDEVKKKLFWNGDRVLAQESQEIWDETGRKIGLLLLKMTVTL